MKFMLIVFSTTERVTNPASCVSRLSCANMLVRSRTRENRLDWIHATRSSTNWSDLPCKKKRINNKLDRLWMNEEMNEWIQVSVVSSPVVVIRTGAAKLNTSARRTGVTNRFYFDLKHRDCHLLWSEWMWGQNLGR